MNHGMAALAGLVLIFFSQSGGAAPNLPSCKATWAHLIAQGGHRFQPTQDKKYSDYLARIHRVDCQKDWTLLVYMAANNDLAPYALWDLYEMEAAFKDPDLAGSGLATDLVVQLEHASENKIRRLHLFQQSQVPFTIKSRADFENATPAVIKSPVIEMAPKASNATQADRLESFLKWGIKNYPSKNLLVIVWGHGQGWTVYKPKNPLKSGRTLKPSDVSLGLPLETKSTPHGKWGGLAFSDSDGSYLDIPSLNRILGRVSQTRGRPVDLYASDACLMQMLEVSTELSQNARFVVGSTQIQSFNGLPYRSLMWNLNRGSVSRAADPAYAVAQLLPKIMKASMDPRSGSQGRADPSGYKTLLMGSLNTQESNQVLLPALGALGKSLSAYLQEDSFRKSDVQYLIQNTPAFEGNAQDLGIFLGLLDMLVYKETQTTGKPMTPAAASLKRSIDQAKDALNRAVVNYAYGKNYTSAESGLGVSFMPRSLSVWLPSTAEDYKLRRTDFARSRFYKTVPAWGEWLGKLYSQQ